MSTMTNDSRQIARHKTAIRRPSFSLPIKCLLRDSLLDESKSLFDYGCGHGVDLRLLADLKINADGWDPTFQPKTKKRQADVVNIGYVINVIEDPSERRLALLNAWQLCNQLLVVAAQVELAAPNKEQEQFSDGIRTSRGTFQKYYSQLELRLFLEVELQTDAIPAAPGVFYVFKDETAKQQFVSNRYHRRISVPKRHVSETLYEDNRELLDLLMEWLTNYGRLPLPGEFVQEQNVLQRFGSLKKAFKVIQRATDNEPWEEIARKRKDDLLVYLALARFKKRPSFSVLPRIIQNDIKVFLGGYKDACDRADELLFRAGDPSAIDEACYGSAVGQLVENALIVHRSTLNQLNPILRIYEGCAKTLLGEIDDANVIKLHRYSGKVSYLTYADFETVGHPTLRERLKINLRTCSVDVYNYGDWDDPPILFRKEKLLSPEHKLYRSASSLTQQEVKANLLDCNELLDTLKSWNKRLLQSGYDVRGHRLLRLKKSGHDK
jgi:DNA phosphorothioation-associated putative methyltransferase